MYRIYGSLIVISKVFSYVKNKKDINAIHIIGGEPLSMLIYSLFQKKELKKIVILNVHNADFYLPDIENPLKRLYKKILKLIYKSFFFLNFHGIIVHGDKMKIDFIKRIKIHEKYHSRIYPINVGVENANDKSELNISQRSNNSLLFFGVIRKDKGLELAIQALSKSKGWYLTIAGLPKEYSIGEINDIIKLYNVSERVNLMLKYISDTEMNHLFNSHKFLILPYKRSFAAQSVVLTLGAKYRNVIISSDVGQNGHDVKKYDLGYTFKAESEESLISLLSSGIMNSEKKESNYEKYFFDHSWEKIGSRYIKCYSLLEI